MKISQRFRLRWLDELLADIRYASRMAGKQRGFTVLVILTMALGIGAGTATFSILDKVLIRPLPYNDGGRLVSVYMTVPSFRSNPALSKIWDHLGPNLANFVPSPQKIVPSPQKVYRMPVIRRPGTL